MEAQTSSYLVVTIKEWNINQYKIASEKLTGKWHLITKPSELRLSIILALFPGRKFFHITDPISVLKKFVL